MLLAIAVDGARPVTDNFTGAVEADDAAVENVRTDVQEDVVGQVERKVGRLGALRQVLNLRAPPCVADVGEDHAAAALEQGSSTVGDVDRDRRLNVRV